MRQEITEKEDRRQKQQERRLKDRRRGRQCSKKTG
jgi:hypothetical protein